MMIIKIINDYKHVKKKARFKITKTVKAFIFYVLLFNNPILKYSLLTKLEKIFNIRLELALITTAFFNMSNHT